MRPPSSAEIVSNPLIIVSTLIRKLKRARELLIDNEQAFQQLDASASAEQRNEWSAAANQALEKRMDNPTAMDYYSLSIPPGKPYGFESRHCVNVDFKPLAVHNTNWT